MMSVIEAIEYIYNQLDCVYCTNCKGQNLKGDKKDIFCDDCHRKSMRWEISYEEAKTIAEKILLT